MTGLGTKCSILLIKELTQPVPSMYVARLGRDPHCVNAISMWGGCVLSVGLQTWGCARIS